LVNFADLNRSVESSAHTIDKKTEDSSEQQSSLTSGKADENEELLKSKRLHLIEWLRSSVHHLQGFQLWKA
jgi:hypothetical protein